MQRRPNTLLCGLGDGTKLFEDVLIAGLLFLTILSPPSTDGE